MKYLRQHEISAPCQRCSRLIIYDSNKATGKMLAAYKRCWRPEMLASRLLLFGLGRISTLSPSQSGWRALSEGVASPPCSPQVESAHRSAQLIWAASLPYCHGLLYQHDLPKCSRPSNVRGRRYLTLFSEKNQKPNSAHKCPITSIQICTESQKLSEFSCITFGSLNRGRTPFQPLFLKITNFWPWGGGGSLLSANPDNAAPGSAAGARWGEKGGGGGGGR